MISILDKRFRYTPASKTDVAATFRRIRREIEQQQAATARKVTPMLPSTKERAK